MARLPIIGPLPDYTSLDENSVPVDRQQVVTDNSQQVLGQGITKAADTLQDAVDAGQKADAVTKTSNAITNLKLKAIADVDTAKQSAAPDGSGFSKGVLENFDKTSADSLTAATASGNPKVSQFLQPQIQNLRTQIAEHAMGWEYAQRTAFRTSSVTDNTQKLASVVEADPTQFASSLAQQRAVIDNIGLEPSERATLTQHATATLADAAAAGVARQNPQAMIDAINKPDSAPDDLKTLVGGLSNQQREVFRAKAQQQISTGYANSVVAAYRTQGPTAGAQALSAIDKLDQPPDIKAAILNDAQRGIDEWHAEARQTHAQDIIGLEERLGSGKTTPDDRGLALGLFRNGTLTAQQTGETIGRIEKSQEKKVDDDAIYQYASQAYQGGQALDPKDEHIRKAMDVVFTVATNHVPPGSPEWINRAADIGAKTGVTPDSAVGWARTNLISGDPATAAQAANAVQRITDANPRGAPFALDEHTKTMAKIVNDAVMAGTDPKVAVENARQITSMPDAARTRLEQIYNTKKASAVGDLSNQLKDPANGFRAHFWNGIPDVPPQMQGQFEELRSNYFKLTNGNVDQANKLATADLKNTWGITQVNGQKEFMQFAPEAMNPGLSTQAVQDDMQAAAKGHTDDPTKVRLLTTQDTYQSNGQRWGLGVPDKFGAYSALTDSKGRVIPYQLPTATQAVKDQAAKAAAAGMAKLHDLQAIEREKEKNELGEVYAQGHQAGY